MTARGMTGAEPSLPDKIVAVHDAFNGARIAHAFGGALALAYYAEPRATIDIDINVFVAADEHAAVAEALRPLGVGVDMDPLQLQRDGQVRLWWGRTPLDLFFSYDPVHDAMRRASRPVPFGDRTIPVLSPEHLLVCKVVFDRPKDWLDVDQVLTCVPDLDAGEVERWLERIIGGADARAQRFDAARRGLLGG